jgi:chromosome segregation ATPase
MEFHDYATNEASALIARLLTRQSASSSQQLHALREAIDSAATALEATPQLEDQVHEFAARLNKAVSAATRSIREEARKVVEGLRSELEEQRRSSEKLGASLGALEAQLDRVRAELRIEQDRAEMAERCLAAAREAHQELDVARDEAEAACRHEAQLRASVEDVLRETCELVERATSDTIQVVSQLEAERTENATLKAALAASREANRELDAAREETEAACSHEAQLRASIEHELRDTRGLLDRAATRTAEVVTQLDAERSDNATLKAALGAAHHVQRQLETARDEAEAACRHGAELQASVENELRDARGLLDRATAETAQVVSQLETERAANKSLQGALAASREANRELEAARTEAYDASLREAELRASVDNELRDTRALLDRATTETARVVTQLDAERSENATLKGALGAAREAHSELETARDDAEAACRHEAQLRASVEDVLRETCALVDRATTETAQVVSELETERTENTSLKGALTAAHNAHRELGAARAEAEAACVREAQVRATVENELRDARGLLDLAITETTQIVTQLEAERSENAALKSALAAAQNAHRELDAAREKAAAACSHEAQVRATVENELLDTRGLLDRATTETARVVSQLEAERTENATLKGALTAAHQAHEREAQARAAADCELQDARRMLDTALADVEQLNSALKVSAGEKRKLLTDITSMEGELHGVQAQCEGVSAQLKVSVARVHRLEFTQSKQEELMGQLQAKLDVALQGATPGTGAEVVILREEVDRLVSMLETSVRSLDELEGATTVDDLLAALAQRLWTQFSRVALFRVKENRMEGEHQIGFDQTTNIRGLVVPLSVDSMLTRVARTRTVERLTGPDFAGRSETAPFGGRPAAALALPVVLHGATRAVVYVDDGGEPGFAPGLAASEASVEFAKLLVRHTVVQLMRLTRQHTTSTELPLPQDLAAVAGARGSNR